MDKHMDKKTFELNITGYAHDGAGVGRKDNDVIFVPGALAGEKIVVEVKERKKGIFQGRLLEILHSHTERVEPVCEVFRECGGCQLQHVAYSEQLRIKEQIVRDALERLGGISKVKISPVIGMEEPWHYRNKGHFQVRKIANNVKLSFYEEGSRQPVSQFCRYLFSKQTVLLISFLEEVLTRNKVDIAEGTKNGLKHILLRESKANGKIILVLITNGSFSSEKMTIAREICGKFPDVAGVCESINKKDKGPVLGQKVKVILGTDKIIDKIGSFSFEISPQSFFQVNNLQAEVIYEKVLDMAQLSGREIVIDAYCGIGTISLFLAKRAKKVIGLETISEAVEDAKKNAKANGLANVEFVKGEAEKILPQMVAEGIKIDLIVVDPPRKGCKKELLEAVVQSEVTRIIYVSCNPATLARDIKILRGSGYDVTEVQPVDMFPQTSHVEVIVGIQRSDL